MARSVENHSRYSLEEIFHIYNDGESYVSNVSEAGRDEHCEQADYNVWEIITPVT